VARSKTERSRQDAVYSANKELGGNLRKAKKGQAGFKKKSTMVLSADELQQRNQMEIEGLTILDDANEDEVNIFLEKQTEEKVPALMEDWDPNDVEREDPLDFEIDEDIVQDTSITTDSTSDWLSLIGKEKEKELVAFLQKTQSEL